MLRKEQNDLVSQAGPGTPMGQLFRSYWTPALLAEELPENDQYYWRITQYVMPSFTMIAPRGGHTVHGRFLLSEICLIADMRVLLL